MPDWLALAKQTIDSADRDQCHRQLADRARVRVLTALAGDEAAEQTELSRSELLALLADGLGGRAGRANFRTGTLTVCTMYPMRSVPHRVVCLLGMDDLGFPRRTRSDGDDLLARDPWLGDRDRRSEDRQLLLDAIMSATDHLIAVYSGADPRTGAKRPPAVPIGELLDTVDETVRTGRRSPSPLTGAAAASLQPFDTANFAAARAARRSASTPPPSAGHAQQLGSGPTVPRSSRSIRSPVATSLQRWPSPTWSGSSRTR